MISIRCPQILFTLRIHTSFSKQNRYISNVKYITNIKKNFSKNIEKFNNMYNYQYHIDEIYATSVVSTIVTVQT